MYKHKSSNVVYLSHYMIDITDIFQANVLRLSLHQRDVNHLVTIPTNGLHLSQLGNE